MAFARIDTGGLAAAPAPLLGFDTADWLKIIEAAMLSITALLVGLFVVRPLITRMLAPIEPGRTTGLAQIGNDMVQNAGQPAASATALPAPVENGIDLSRIEGQVKESAIRKVGEVVESHPEEALAIIRTWMHQPA
jgi:flagellar M-ring protein FliF